METLHQRRNGTPRCSLAESGLRRHGTADSVQNTEYTKMEEEAGERQSQECQGAPMPLGPMVY